MDFTDIYQEKNKFASILVPYGILTDFMSIKHFKKICISPMPVLKCCLEIVFFTNSFFAKHLPQFC